MSCANLDFLVHLGNFEYMCETLASPSMPSMCRKALCHSTLSITFSEWESVAAEDISDNLLRDEATKMMFAAVEDREKIMEDLSRMDHEYKVVNYESLFEKIFQPQMKRIQDNRKRIQEEKRRLYYESLFEKWRFAKP